MLDCVKGVCVYFVFFLSSTGNRVFRLCVSVVLFSEKRSRMFFEEVGVYFFIVFRRSGFLVLSFFSV